MSRVTLQRRDNQQPCAFDGNSTCTLIFDNGHEIRYSDSWAQHTGVHTPHGETSHSTGQPGANMFISFYGTRIAATGTIPAGEAPLSANYIIDNGQVITQSVSGVSQDVFHQTFFTSPVLGNGPHNLTVQVIETGSGRNYTFQNFQIATSDGDNTTASSENEANSGSRGKSLAIIGGILGAVIFLFIINVWFLWLWRKRRLSRTPDVRHPFPIVQQSRPMDGLHRLRRKSDSPKLVLQQQLERGRLSLVYVHSVSEILPSYSTVEAQSANSRRNQDEVSTARAPYATSRTSTHLDTELHSISV